MLQTQHKVEMAPELQLLDLQGEIFLHFLDALLTQIQLLVIEQEINKYLRST